MTEKVWDEEVRRVIASSGLPWRVFAAWVHQGSERCEAELVDIRSDRERTIAWWLNRFPSEADRQPEMVRQVQALKG